METGLPVERWNPAVGLADVAPEVDRDLLREHDAGLAVALGLCTTPGGFGIRR